MLICFSVECRIQIRQTGSSTIYPFALRVTREFSKKSTYICPLVESIGTLAGFTAFSQDKGVLSFDIVNASRKIKPEELAACKKFRVGPILEVCIGIDAIALATKKSLKRLKDLKIKDIFLAVAEKITNEKGKLIDNPYKKWSDIDPKFPDSPIRILIPSKTHGTRDSFEAVVMNGYKGIRKGPEVREISDYEAADSHDLLFEFLEHNDNTLAFIALNLLDTHHDRIMALPINSVEPTYSNIQKGAYAMARQLFLYVKEDHFATTKHLQDYINEWMSTEAIGKEGYLTKMGLVPLLANVKKIRRL